VLARSPKYFSYLCVDGTLAAVIKCSQSPNRVFLLKKIEVFSLFIFYLEALS
jgi:hypothetical protein